MRSNFLLTLIAIMLTSYAKGDVTITAEDAGGGKLRIGYQTTGTLAPVAFALDIQLSNGATFSSVTSLTGDFSFYPSRFRDFINPSNPNWENPNYLPVTSWAEPDALGGLGTSGVTVEMGQMLVPYLASGSDADFDSDGQVNMYDLDWFSDYWLWAGGFAEPPDLDRNGIVDFHDYSVFLQDSPYIPSMEGELLLLQLNGNGAEMTTAIISLNLTRGGVVLEDATAGNAIMPTQVTVIVPEPATLLLLGLGGLILRKNKK